MQRINLLYVITKLELGGAQKQLLSLIRHLDQNRYKIFLFTGWDGFLIPETQSLKGLTLKKSRYLVRPINPLKDLLALVEIRRFIKENNIDIVHTHSSKAGILGRLAARLAKTRVILHTVHGWSFNDYQPWFLRWFFIALERFVARFTDRIIVVSNFDKHRGLNNRIGVDGRYELIRYGIDFDEFGLRKKNIRNEFKINSNDLVVGMIACFKPQKSPQDFVRLASLVSKTTLPLKFILVGDGVLRKKIEKLVCKFNLQKQVILTGWRKDIPEILSTLDIFVLTSLWEGLPICVLEAMASSKPVISTNTGGIEEVIAEGKSGFLASPGDLNKMAEKLVILLKDSNLRLRMGSDAKGSLDSDFNSAHMIMHSQNLYDRLMLEKGKAYAN